MLKNYDFCEKIIILGAFGALTFYLYLYIYTRLKYATGLNARYQWTEHMKTMNHADFCRGRAALQYEVRPKNPWPRVPKSQFFLLFSTFAWSFATTRRRTGPIQHTLAGHPTHTRTGRGSPAAAAPYGRYQFNFRFLMQNNAFRFDHRQAK